MPPTKTQLHLRSTISTRSKKRKADVSPVKQVNVKRSAFGEITNNLKIDSNATKNILNQKKSTLHILLKGKQNENLGPPKAPAKPTTRASLRKENQPNGETLKAKADQKENVAGNVKSKRLSEQFENSGESLYCSALEEVNSSTSSSLSRKSKGSSADPTTPVSDVTLVAHQLENQLNLGNHQVPEGVHDFDKENWDDVYQISNYAMDIFNYLKSREDFFVIPDYMHKQAHITKLMRSLLVDWMVEIQESFELNHETLYLGVKLVDSYLSKVTVDKTNLQCVGAAAMFIACKYDERITPQIDDFLYVCDNAYSKNDLIRMEINILKVVDFQLGMPLSYRFLRRYARTEKVTMPILTLARFILELSLMEYTTVTMRDSQLAAASLFLALQMKKVSGWTRSLEFYTGRKEF